MEYKLFYEITGVLILAGLIAMLVNLLKQPSILAYILTGLVLGPLGYWQLQNTQMLESLGQIGIALLLFMVGLELDLKRVKELGKTAIYVGLGQLVFAAGIGFIFSRILGFGILASFYIALALSFSSTIIVVKLLGEKRDLQSLYGRIAMGILIVQDFVALGVLLLLGSANQQANFAFSIPGWQILLTVLVKALMVTLLLIWLSKKVFPKFLNKFGKSDELLSIFAIAWALGFAAFMSLPFVGFSLEIGGFLAGLALANSQVHYEIAAKVKSIRDFFLIIFFIVFGTKLVFAGVLSLIVPAILLSAFVLFVQPLVVIIIMSRLGYKPRTSFFASLTVAQISEFSFVLMLAGNKLGHIGQRELGLVTLVGIITITASSYMILYSQKLYDWLKKPLRIFDTRKGSAENLISNVILENHIILIGAHRLGAHLLAVLKNLHSPFVIVDFDPEIAADLAKQGYNVICGDIADPYIQDQVNLEKAKLIISTVPTVEDNLALVDAILFRLGNKKQKPKMIFTAQNEQEIQNLYEKEIDYVISPHFIGGLHLAKILEEDHNFIALKKLKKHHLKIIESRI